MLLVVAFFMIKPFSNPGCKLFGRSPDLDYLSRRSENVGVTFLFGRSQMGKSAVLKEMASRLSQTAPHVSGRPACLVGYFESFGQEDLFLRAVSDLYVRWLSDSSYLEQAKMVIKQKEKDLINTFGEVAGNIFESILKVGGKPLEVIGAIVKSTLNGLVQTNRDLQNGGIQLAQLSIEQGRDILTIIHAISGRPLILILDQWHKSSRLENDTNLLESFIRQCREWPPCHIFVASLSAEAPVKAARSLHLEFPREVASYELPSMHLENSDARTEFLEFVRREVPAVETLSDSEIIEIIDGYPAVFNRWTSVGPVLTSENLRELALDAHAHRFSEMNRLLELPDSERTLAMRIALLPEIRNTETWAKTKPVILEGFSGKHMDLLLRRGLLEASSPPTFGNDIRTFAALECLRLSFPGSLSDVREGLVISLSRQVSEGSLDDAPYLESLANLYLNNRQLELSTLAKTLCISTLSIFGMETLDFADYLSVRQSLGTDIASFAPLLLMGLVNLLGFLDAQGKFSDMPDVLQEILALGNDFLEIAAIRKTLAIGLVIAIISAQKEGDLESRDLLLDEIRNLCERFVEDPAVRFRFVAAAFYTGVHVASEEGMKLREEAMVEELDILRNLFPDDEIWSEICQPKSSED